MVGEDAQDDQRPSAEALADAEQLVAVALCAYLGQVADVSSDPVVARLAEGVLAVLLGSDRDVLAAIEKYPELLTDRGSALFRDVAIFSQQLGAPRVIELVKRRQAKVQAVRETRG